MDDRITELEVKVAFQDHLLAELDGVIQNMRHEIEDLQRQVRELREQADLGEEDKDQKPPHY